MSSLVRTLACVALALGAGMAAHVSAVADDRAAHPAQWVEAAARQAQQAQRRQREARLRWEYERRRSAAHARMPNTLYASTPGSQAEAQFSCPALVDEDARRLYRSFLDGRRGTPMALTASGMESGRTSRNASINVFPAQRRGSSSSPSWRPASASKADGPSHLIQPSAWTPATYQSKSASEDSQHVYLFPSASEPLREGFVRIINHSTEAGGVTINPIDDGGREFDTITLSIDASETVHFNSGDLETGNEGKGLSGSTGSGQGDWRLELSSDLDIEVLSYIRTGDGFLTAMHDVAPVQGDIHRVAIFNPGSNKNQVSRLRLINPTDGTAEVTIRGTDDKGMPGTGEVTVSLEAGAAGELTAEALESGASGFEGMLGDGSGKWRLEVKSEQAIVAMSLLESPTDHLTNLSTVPREPEDGVHVVPLFPRAGDESGRQGFVRAINRSDTAGGIRIKAYDESERDYEAVTLAVGANEVVHFNSDDLEQGTSDKGLSGGVGAGEGDWRLEMTSDLDMEVLSYIRTKDGFLTSMHDVAPSAGTRHRVAVFNPGSNRKQESLLRLINPGDETAEVTITGTDGNGAPGASAVSLSIAAGGSRTVGAWNLESGAEGLDGALGDGADKWQLMIDADRPVVAMSLLRSPTGHLTNLSTAPVRGAEGGAVQEPQTAEAVFRQLISGPIVQSKCINCHVQGGASGNTRLVFVTDANPDHEAINLRVFEDLLDEEEDGASYMLNKIQGALGHGGGIQVAAGTDEYTNMERFLALLGEDVGPVAITPDTLFDGVRMEPSWKTLRRAAIILAGRIPTDEEYESIKTGSLASLRVAIRNLMEGPGFHQFLIRGSNDRLLTDRDDIQGVGVIDPIFGYFVEYNNLNHGKLVAKDPNHGTWRGNVDYGIARAPLELVAYVVENDLPYTEILTADYIMANPMAAEAYGAPTEFNNPKDVHEFQPSEIVSYYRNDESKEFEYTRDTGGHVIDPGNLVTDYPHAGILNTTVFLKRYPTTATNRNRARSRWTYYHFLGLDIEKSASRTTDPVALADTNNPTMHNPACTVCHTVLDPVAGAFQNYDLGGYYKVASGGLDSLDDLYKEGDSATRHLFEVSARSWEDRETVSFSVWMRAGEHTVALAKKSDHNIHVDHLTIRDSDGVVVERIELEESTDEKCGASWTGNTYELIHCPLIVVVEIPIDGEYEIETSAYVGYDYAEEPGQPATLAIWASYDGYQTGDTWYRGMRAPGFDGQVAPDSDNSLQWLAEKIVADDRFSEATVKFWWPVIMGSPIVEPPVDQDDADFESRLLASNAQSAEVEKLAGGFRSGFQSRSPYNLKDLLTEIVLSKWFRANSVDNDNAVQVEALEHAGANRLLTPEELSAKTLAVTGFDWQRMHRSQPWFWGLGESRNWTGGHRYGLLYGGIDSGGVAERARDMTAVMGGVAKRHAGAVSCPVVMKDFYLLPDNERRLFSGISNMMSPAAEFHGVFDVVADSAANRDTITVEQQLKAGPSTVLLSLKNELWDESVGSHLRTLYLDKLALFDDQGTRIHIQEFEQLDDQYCLRRTEDAIEFWDQCPVAVTLDIPVDGNYFFEVVAWSRQAGDELAKLEMVIESDTDQSAGAIAIRDKLVELHETLLGVRLDADSPGIQDVYNLFVEIWKSERTFSDITFDIRCDWDGDQYYFEGILDDAWVAPESELDWDWDRHGWNQERIGEYFAEIDLTDTYHVARTWTVILAYLLTDYRYLYL